jgi:hypothetical protein
MGDPELFTGRKEDYLWVKDADGEEYLCPKGSLKKKSDLTDEELKNCVPDSKAGGGASVGG